MKKIRYIMMIAGFAAIGCGQAQPDVYDNNKSEIAGYCNDMIEYINYDLRNGDIDSLVAETYIRTMNEIADYNNGCQNCDEID